VLCNGYEELDKETVAIIKQMANNGFGSRIDEYCYIEIPYWGIVRLDYDPDKGYVWPSYVPWIGF